MEYLTSIPESSKSYGINKVLTVRHLSIDWKHRDTELHLRSPELYDRISDIIEFRDLLKIRSNQLRLIHHIPRSIFHDKHPNKLVCINLHRNITLIREYSNIVYIDFYLLLKTSDGISTYKAALRGKHTKVILFSTFITESAMIHYCIKHGLPLAFRYRVIKSIDILETVRNNIVSVFSFHTTFTDNELLYLWLLNVNIITTNDTNSTNPVGFKTNKDIKDIYG